MSTSLLRDAELDPEAHSGEDQDHMDKDHHDVQGHPSEFEVKEQDRWLPIANGRWRLDIWFRFTSFAFALTNFPLHFFFGSPPVLFVSGPFMRGSLFQMLLSDG